MTESLSLTVAFTAGLLSFLSPCVLPLIPGYVAFITGRSLEELTQARPTRELMWSTTARALLFGAGFTTVFTALGASASVAGRALASAAPVLSRVAGVVIIVLGLHTLGVLRLPWLAVERRVQTHRIAPSAAGAFVIGMAFAFGWTPCIGPILAGILALAAAQDTVPQGIGLLLAYSAGLGVPFVLTAVSLGAFMAWLAKYRRIVVWGERGAGGLLVVLGLLMVMNRLTWLLQFVPERFYQFVR